jgi:hypothetical protein
MQLRFQTHAAFLGYWRERRELSHALRVHMCRTEAKKVSMRIRKVELLVRRLEETNVRIMTPGGLSRPFLGGRARHGFGGLQFRLRLRNSG